MVASEVNHNSAMQPVMMITDYRLGIWIQVAVEKADALPGHCVRSMKTNVNLLYLNEKYNRPLKNHCVAWQENCYKIKSV